MATTEWIFKQLLLDFILALVVIGGVGPYSTNTGGAIALYSTFYSLLYPIGRYIIKYEQNMLKKINAQGPMFVYTVK